MDADFYIRPFSWCYVIHELFTKGYDDNEYDWWRGERRMGESEREGKGEDVKCGKEIGFSGDF